MFVSLEGIDGSGKTTQAKRLAEALGGETALVREPGGTEASERIRELLVDSAVELDPLAELLLFCAARAELVAEVIRPATEARRDVVCDRFSDSSVAYQGAARGLGVERVARLCDEATGGIEPDLTLLLRIDPEVGAKRSASGDRFESEGISFQRAIARAYDEIAGRHAGRVVVVDGERDVEAVHEEIVGIVKQRKGSS